MGAFTLEPGDKGFPSVRCSIGATAYLLPGSNASAGTAAAAAARPVSSTAPAAAAPAAPAAAAPPTTGAIR